MNRIISNLYKNFLQDELAYLAITSKVERPIRDKIAFGLHENFSSSYAICREWNDRENNKDKNHTDIALIKWNDTKPSFLIELKARSVPGFTTNYANILKEDLLKMSLVAESTTEMYLIFFNNCVETRFDPKYFNKVKYLRRINSKIKKGKKIESEIDENWIRYCEVLPEADSKKIKIRAGNYYNNPVSIITYVYGPIFKKDVTKNTQER